MHFRIQTETSFRKKELNNVLLVEFF